MTDTNMNKEGVYSPELYWANSLSYNKRNNKRVENSRIFKILKELEDNRHISEEDMDYVYELANAKNTQSVKYQGIHMCFSNELKRFLVEYPGYLRIMYAFDGDQIVRNLPQELFCSVAEIGEPKTYCHGNREN